MRLINDHSSGRRREREEGVEEVCPVTIAQPRSSAEELLAMQIYREEETTKTGKKNFKETFPPLFTQACLYSQQASDGN